MKLRLFDCLHTPTSAEEHFAQVDSKPLRCSGQTFALCPSGAKDYDDAVIKLERLKGSEVPLNSVTPEHEGRCGEDFCTCSGEIRTCWCEKLLR